MLRSDRLWLRLRSVDWPGWIALAWALWFGGLYIQMVVQTQEAKVRTLLAPASAGVTKPMVER
jgi:hypothetical protein